MKYELFYLVGISRETELPKIKTDLKNIVLEEGGVFEEKETEEKRKLSYEVKHETHGIFVAQRFELPEVEKVQTIIKKVNLYPNILRFLVSKTEDLPELRTKEERLKGFPQQQQIKEKPIKKTSEPQVRKFEKIESAKEEPKKPAHDASPSDVGGKELEEQIDSEDIDKKLEEILNI
jgi:ribosomal protein S6